MPRNLCKLKQRLQGRSHGSCAVLLWQGGDRNISDALGCTENQSTRVSLCSVLQTNAWVWNLLFFSILICWCFFSSLLNSAEHVPCFASLQDPSPTFQSSSLSLDSALANNIDDLSFSPKRKRNMLPGALVYGVKAIPAEKSLQMKSDRHFPRWHCFPNRFGRRGQQPPFLFFPYLFC